MANLGPLAAAHLTAAHADAHGRSAEIVVRDGELRQTVVALVGGAVMHEHSTPPAASIQVLQGHIQVTGADDGVLADLASGQLWQVVHERHAVVALEDSAFLLTTVTNVDRDAG